MKIATVKYFDVEYSATEKPKLLKNIPIENVKNDHMLNSVFSSYTDLQGANGELPAKSSLNIKKMKLFLNRVFLLEILNSNCPNSCRYYYRVVGTDLRDIFGQEMSMKNLNVQQYENIKSHMCKLYECAEREKKPLLMEGELASVSHDSNSATTAINTQVLLLPFSNEGKAVDHILGVISY